jgi:hypothetical protein
LFLNIKLYEYSILNTPPRSAHLENLGLTIIVRPWVVALPRSPTRLKPFWLSEVELWLRDWPFPEVPSVSNGPFLSAWYRLGRGRLNLKPGQAFHNLQLNVGGGCGWLLHYPRHARAHARNKARTYTGILHGPSTSSTNAQL